jgi:hypothetical protein
MVKVVRCENCSFGWIDPVKEQLALKRPAHSRKKLPAASTLALYSELFVQLPVNEKARSPKPTLVL